MLVWTGYRLIVAVWCGARADSVHSQQTFLRRARLPANQRVNDSLGQPAGRSIAISSRQSDIAGGIQHQGTMTNERQTRPFAQGSVTCLVGPASSRTNYQFMIYRGQYRPSSD